MGRLDEDNYHIRPPSWKNCTRSDTHSTGKCSAQLRFASPISFESDSSVILEHVFFSTDMHMVADCQRHDMHQQAKLCALRTKTVRPGLRPRFTKFFSDRLKRDYLRTRFGQRRISIAKKITRKESNPPPYWCSWWCGCQCCNIIGSKAEPQVGPGRWE